MSGPDAAVTALRTAVYTVPTPQTEGDGTLSWSATTAVTVEVDAGGRTGLGWSYTSASTAALIDEHLAGVARGRDPMDVPGAWEAMVRATRNLGRGGPTSQAIAAVDIALWDLKARLLGLPLAAVFGQARDTVPVYGSGGFTTLSDAELRSQVQGWLAAGCEMVKIKVGQSWGARPRRDLERTRLVRQVVGGDVQVMVDANGGYTVGQAKTMGEQYDQLGVTWFEEPVSSDHLEALAVVRSVVRCDVAAGEYAASVFDARRLCPVLDCLQLDVTRCAGYHRMAARRRARRSPRPGDLRALRPGTARTRRRRRAQPAARRAVRRPRPTRAAAVRRRPTGDRRPNAARPRLDGTRHAAASRRRPVPQELSATRPHPKEQP